MQQAVQAPSAGCPVSMVAPPFHLAMRCWISQSIVSQEKSPHQQARARLPSPLIIY
jgi:hypothetical protein